MATLSSTVHVEHEPKLGGRGPGERTPHRKGWGGGDGEGGGSDDPVSSPERLRRCRLGLAFGLASVLMMFIGLSSAYIVRQGASSWDADANAYVRDWQPMQVPALLWLNTLLLAVSSFTLELARRSTVHARGFAEMGIAPPRRAYLMPWLEMTLIFGLAFLMGQYLAWRELANQGIFVATNPSSSFFYLLTGTHAVHLLGGLAAMFYVVIARIRSTPFYQRQIALDVTTWYWHFMGLLWVYLFALLHFAR